MTQQDGAQITVAVCTYNRHAQLRELLVALSQQTLDRSRYRVLVVDNSEDAAARKAFADEARSMPGVDLVYSSPPGLSRARNVALQRCTTELIAYIDDDARPEPGWLTALVEGFQASGASVLAGPIVPLWPVPQPAWLPPKYVACLTILDYGAEDRWLGDYEFAYGANIAFRASALREVGGFNISLGRAGGHTLISEEEIAVQLAFRKRGHKGWYAAKARVSHMVHENRLSRNYFRARLAWQAVSDLMHDSPLWNRDYSRSEFMRVCSELGLGDLPQRLFTGGDAETFSKQIELIYHLFLVILSSKDQGDASIEGPMLPALQVAVAGSSEQHAKRRDRPIADVFRPMPAIAPRTRHLFVEGLGSHGFLLDTYARLPGSQVVTISADLWSHCGEQLRYVERSLAPQLESFTIVTLEPLVYGYSSSDLLAMLRRITIPTYGIIHRPPWTDMHASLLRQVAQHVKQFIVLSEGMFERLRDTYQIHNVVHLPLHPSHLPYLVGNGERERARIGAQPADVVVSILGEARKGKGIELLLESLAYIEPTIRGQLFILIAGRAKDFDPVEITGTLNRNQFRGHIDLRASASPLDFAVLTDRELGQYVNITDVGLVLYQGDQRFCMSGLLSNYLWGRKQVIATRDSFVGHLVAKHECGTALTRETPCAVAKAIGRAVRAIRDGIPTGPGYERVRASLAPEVALDRLGAILRGEVDPAVPEGSEAIASTRRS